MNMSTASRPTSAATPSPNKTKSDTAATGELGSRLLRDLVVEQRSLGSLKPNPRNARTHNKKQIKAIADSIRAFGFVNPILIDDDDVIIAGHGRWKAGDLLGLDQVPTIRVSALSEAQKRALVLADNKLAERAGWDPELLAIELGELSTLLPDLGLTVELTGFEIGEIDSILNDTQENQAANIDDEPEPLPATPLSQPGDLWVLGRHRLLCSDSRDAATYDALLGAERVDMVLADAPYNTKIAGFARGRGKTHHADFAMASGEMSEAEFIVFLQTVFGHSASHSRDGALHFLFIDWRHFGNLLVAGQSIYSELKNLVVWVKSNGGQGSLYRSQHELIAVFKVGTGDHINNIELGRFGRNRSNVWHYAGVNAFKAGRTEELQIHPTVKPIALLADAIKDVTSRNAIILDMFGGSGSTLIAAERTGRSARLIEIEPRYVDVTVKRFERITGRDAVHAQSGKTSAELASERSAQVR